MTHSALEGLNIVQPKESSYDQQDPLDGPQFPDLAAQLDLWTNLTFQSDEPLVKGNDDPSSPALSDDEKDDGVEPEGTAALDGHTNVVNPTETGQSHKHPTMLIRFFQASVSTPSLSPMSAIQTRLCPLLNFLLHL